MAADRLVDLFLAGFAEGLSGSTLAHWALAEAGCAEPWVGPMAPATVGRLVTHAEPFRLDRPVQAGDILLRWMHPHGADARVGCVVCLSGTDAVVLTTEYETWDIHAPDVRGHLRAQALCGKVTHG